MTSKENQIIIAKRFRGPPQSGNGGLVSGVFANLINPEHNAGGEVTLRSPTPLDQPMRTNVNPPGSAVVHQDSTHMAGTFSNERHEATQQIRDKTSGPDFLFSAEEPKSSLPQRNRVSSGLLLLRR